MKIRSFIGLIAAVLSVGSAYSQTLTYYSGSQNLSATYQTFNLPQFDPSLGTLLSVTVFTTNTAGNSTPTGPTISGTVNIINNDGVVLTIDNYFATFQTRQQPLSTLGYTSTLSDIDPVSTSPSAVGANIDPSSSQLFTVSPGQTFAAVSQTINSSFFSAYTGLGNVQFQARAPQTIATAGTDYTVQNNTTTPLVFGVTYTYDPIPEPSSAALAGLAVLGLVSRRRRH